MIEKVDPSFYVALTAYFASFLAVTGSIWKLFDRAEKVVSLDAKEKLADWLMRVDPEGSTNRLALSFFAIPVRDRLGNAQIS